MVRGIVGRRLPTAARDSPIGLPGQCQVRDGQAERREHDAGEMLNTPDDVRAKIHAHIKRPPGGDLSHLTTPMTTTGKEVWKWVMAQPWLRDHPEPTILERREEAYRYEIVERYDVGGGTDTISIIFCREDGRWKFHDVFLHEMQGACFDMHVSSLLHEPQMAGITLVRQNQEWLRMPDWLVKILADNVTRGASDLVGLMRKGVVKKRKGVVDRQL
jgi:hypothetical protein